MRYLFILLLLLPFAANANANANLSIKLSSAESDGLCAVSKLPNGQLFIYSSNMGVDATCTNNAIELAGKKKTVAMLMLSNSGNSVANISPQLLNQLTVKKFVHSGTVNSSFLAQLARQQRSMKIIDLSKQKVKAGEAWSLGEVQLTLISQPQHYVSYQMENGESTPRSSIVVRMDYRNSSQLFSGHSIGRYPHAHFSSCKYAELDMIKNRSRDRIKADFLISAVTTDDLANSSCFISAVEPSQAILISKNSLDTTNERFKRFNPELEKIYWLDQTSCEQDKRVVMDIDISRRGKVSIINRPCS